jgi:phosphoribosyl-ATP pyrophosphohydrolase
MLEQYQLGPQAVLAELARREGLSGLEEKAARKAMAREQAEHGRASGPSGPQQEPQS